MDQLERFIQDNRSAFDDRNPDPALWSAIESRLPQHEARRITLWKAVSVAAVGLVLVLSGVIAGMYLTRSGFEDTAEYAEFRQAEQYYSVQFDRTRANLSQYTYDPAIDEDLAELDIIYQELSQELLKGEHPNKNEIIEALIQNYQTRLSILERILERIEEGNETLQIDEDETEKI